MIPALQNLDFVETNTSGILAQAVLDYQADTGQKLAPGSPESLFLHGNCSQVTRLLSKINLTGKKNLLFLSSGLAVDHIGARVGVKRLPAQPARVQATYALEARAVDYEIPAGSRVTPDGELFFKVETAVTVLAADITATVNWVCLEDGEIGNGFVAGQINQIVDPLPYVTNVANDSITDGGAEIEGDPNFQERIWLAPESFSNAGPEGAYIFYAKSAHQNIADIGVISPAPVSVDVYVLLINGGIPDQAMLDLVATALDKTKVRPLSDLVTVKAPAIVNYDVALSFYVLTDYASQSASIEAAVTEKVDEFVAWQSSKLGRDLTPSRLIEMIQAIPGVQRVETTGPAYQALTRGQVGIVQTITITNGGITDE